MAAAPVSVEEELAVVDVESLSLVVVVADIVVVEERLSKTDVLVVAEADAVFVPVKIVVREVVRSSSSLSLSSSLSSSLRAVADETAAETVGVTDAATAAVRSGALPKAVTTPEAA